MELSSGVVPGKPGVELHLIFGQWIWTGFAGSSTLQVEQNPLGEALLSIYYLVHRDSLTPICVRLCFRLRSHQIQPFKIGNGLKVHSRQYMS